MLLVCVLGQSELVGHRGDPGVPVLLVPPQRALGLLLAEELGQMLVAFQQYFDIDDRVDRLAFYRHRGPVMEGLVRAEGVVVESYGESRLRD